MQAPLQARGQIPAPAEREQRAALTAHLQYGDQKCRNLVESRPGRSLGLQQAVHECLRRPRIAGIDELGDIPEPRGVQLGLCVPRLPRNGGPKHAVIPAAGHDPRRRVDY